MGHNLFSSDNHLSLLMSHWHPSKLTVAGKRVPIGTQHSPDCQVRAAESVRIGSRRAFVTGRVPIGSRFPVTAYQIPIRNLCGKVSFFKNRNDRSLQEVPLPFLQSTCVCWGQFLCRRQRNFEQLESYSFAFSLWPFCQAKTRCKLYLKFVFCLYRIMSQALRARCSSMNIELLPYELPNNESTSHDYLTKRTLGHKGN